MEIVVCKLVPTLKSDEFLAKVNDYNQHLFDWCTANEISSIETEGAFRFGTGDIHR